MRSSGTGSSCSTSRSAQRPARGRSKRSPQPAHVSLPPSSIPSASGPEHPAQRSRYASSVPATLATIRPTDVPRTAPRGSSATPDSSIHSASGAGSGRRGAASTTPSTSMPSRSGACSCSAASIACSIVVCDAPQPLHEPESRSDAMPSSIPSSSTSPPWDSMYGRTLSSASLHPLLQADRVQPVREHEAGDDVVVREARHGLRIQRREDPPQALAVDLDELGGPSSSDISTSRSACAPPCGPCRRPCRTCARRTAGRGRRSGRPA